MLSPVRPSVTRVDQSKMGKDRIRLNNDKLSLEMLLSISFTITNRFISEIRIKCGFIVQYESVFKKYLAHNKILQKSILRYKIRHCLVSWR